MSNPFHVLNPQVPTGARAISPSVLAEKPVQERIHNLLNQNTIMLFMKGVPEMPQCGFSANTVALLHTLGVPFSTYNILEDAELRQTLKEYSQWPTYPQVYFKGELVGGNDILTELYQKGELASAFS